MILGPFIILIEFISYMVRGVTLGLRLAANITAGHLLLGIFAGFV
jgi:F0F1-type ATP synthase membrane subunit a